MPKFMGINLIKRSSNIDVRTFSLFRMSLSQEDRSGSEVITTDFLRCKRICHPAISIAHDCQMLPERL